MRLILLLMLLSIASACLGQDSRSIQKIIISYNRGHYNFKTPGQYAMGEEVILERTPQGFHIARYIKTADSLLPDSITIKHDTSVCRIVQLPFITNHQLDTLVNELNTNRNNFNAASIKPHLPIFSPRKLKQLTKQNYDWKDLSRKERDTVYNRVRRYYRLDDFLRSLHVSINDIFITTDVWNHCKIVVVTAKDTLNYIIDPPVSQPITWWKNKLDVNDQRFVINVDAIFILADLLPNDSYLRRSLGFQWLTERYIAWLFQNADKDFATPSFILR